MSIVNEIFKNLNEGAEVKKPYGDKPEEGKKEKLQKGKRVNVPKAKGNFEKYKARKLEAKNKNAETIYANDTDKVMDKIDSTEHSDKGEIAKVNSKKADRKIKFPYGDKVQKSDSKLIKECDESKVKECDGADCDKKELKEGAYSYGAGLLKEIYNQYVGLGMEDEFFDDCYSKMNISEDELQAWFEMGECDKPVKECDKPEKELSEENMRVDEKNDGFNHVYDADIAERFYKKYKSDVIDADYIMDYCSSSRFGLSNAPLDPKTIDISAVQKELDRIAKKK